MAEAEVREVHADPYKPLSGLGFHSNGDGDSVGVLSRRVRGSDSCFKRITLTALFRLDFKEASTDACY